jgi:succinate dehydrogenase/fumarate reductase cytochrome b subunit
MLKKKNKYSPYLSVYKPQLGNMISILERISGIILPNCGLYTDKYGEYLFFFFNIFFYIFFL